MPFVQYVCVIQRASKDNDMRGMVVSAKVKAIKCCVMGRTVYETSKGY